MVGVAHAVRHAVVAGLLLIQTSALMQSAATTAATTAEENPWERHRPIYHLTPATGYMNDPNGLFYDPEHQMYHVHAQWLSLETEKEKENEGKDWKGGRGWYHFTSRDLVSWRRSEFQDLIGCSGGATIRPDGIPLISVCAGNGATPTNRSDPYLDRWALIDQQHHDPVMISSLPSDMPGVHDCSMSKHSNGDYIMTCGSCSMLPAGTVRSGEAKGSCDGNVQDGNPLTVSYRSQDAKIWSFVGVSFKVDRARGPRIECPYEAEVGGGKSVFKTLAPDLGKDFYYVGSSSGDGSTFVPDSSSQGGLIQDYGHGLAGALMQAPDRLLMWSWLKDGGYSLEQASPAVTFNSALSLPMVVGVDPNDKLPTFDFAPELKQLRTWKNTESNVTLAHGQTFSMSPPEGASGDAIELYVIFTLDTPSDGFVLRVRATEDGSEYTDMICSRTQGLEMKTVSNDPLAGDGGGGKDKDHKLRAGRHSLRVFVDKSVIQATLDKRTSISGRAYPSSSTAVYSSLINQGNGPVVVHYKMWGMRSIWQ